MQNVVSYCKGHVLHIDDLEGLGDDNSSGESGDDDQVMNELEVQTCYLPVLGKTGLSHLEASCYQDEENLC